MRNKYDAPIGFAIIMAFFIIIMFLVINRHKPTYKAEIKKVSLTNI